MDFRRGLITHLLNLHDVGVCLPAAYYLLLATNSIYLCPSPALLPAKKPQPVFLSRIQMCMSKEKYTPISKNENF